MKIFLLVVLLAILTAGGVFDWNGYSPFTEMASEQRHNGDILFNGTYANVDLEAGGSIEQCTAALGAWLAAGHDYMLERALETTQLIESDAFVDFAFIEGVYKFGRDLAVRSTWEEATGAVGLYWAEPGPAEM